LTEAREAAPRRLLAWTETFTLYRIISTVQQVMSLVNFAGCYAAVQAEVWNVDIAAKSLEYTDVQLSSADARPGRKVIAEHVKVVTCFSS